MKPSVFRTEGKILDGVSELVKFGFIAILFHSAFTLLLYSIQGDVME